MMWKFNDFYNNIALIDDNNGKVTYSELELKGRKILEFINKRSLVFLLSSNTIGSLLGYTTFINNNIVPLLLDCELDRKLLNDLISTYKPDYFWIPSNLLNEFENYNCVLEMFEYALLKTNYNKEYILHDELALLLTTSGSTGSPKLVRQSYKNILANTKSIVEYLELDSNERPITTLPMNYTYGLSIINTHLFVGATILLTSKSILEKEFWSFLKEQSATSFGGVPYTYEILNKLKFDRMELPSLKTLTQAGGKLFPELHKKFAEYASENNKKFIVMYGQTEATARMGYLPYEKAIEKCGSMGIAIPGGEFILVDSNNNDIMKSGIVGELKYRGDNVTLGYAECCEDLSKGNENNGELITGDMAKRDEDGYYFIVGRKKRFLKIFGNRVNLDEVESILKSNYKDIEFACAGIDDSMYIFATDISSSNNIRQYISKVTGLNSSAFKIKKINNIPKNDSGKILYKNLEEFYD